MATKQSASALGVLFAVVACAAAAYLFIGPSGYGISLLCMLGTLMLLGMPAKINRNGARVVAVLLTLGGIGSTVLLNNGMSGEALAVRAVTVIIFVFTTISAIGFLFKLLMGVVGMVAIIGFIGYIMGGEAMQTQQSPEQLDFGPEEDKTSEERPNDLLRTHLRNWKDYEARNFEGSLEVWAGDAKASNKHRNSMKIYAQATNEYWGQVYTKLVNHDSRHLERVIDMFATVGREKKLNQVQLANAIVACIQQIPYVLIYRGDCNKIPEEAPQLTDIIKQSPCKGGVEYGLQAPTEFMYDLRGDCDTRTVLLFTVLGKLGYKVCILNSEQYGHSMLGVELPASGTYKSFKGSRYYFWETTATNWELGVLPPEMGQVQYWDVVLAN
jgi:hypothetical protein